MEVKQRRIRRISETKPIYPGRSSYKRRKRSRPPWNQKHYTLVAGGVVFLSTTFLFFSFPWKLHVPLHVQENMSLYRKVYNGDSSSKTIMDPYALPFPVGDSDFLRIYQVSECPLTVVFMDPRPANPAETSSAWRFALESVAAFEPKACVLILTTTSTSTIATETTTAAVSIDPAESEARARKHIYQSSLPLLQNMIHDGRVRVSFFDWEAYGLQSATDFGNPTPAFLSANFWKDEFVDADSDVVLIIQDDSVLCRSIPPSLKQYAWVGAVWPRQATQKMPFPPEGMCDGMANYWKSWLRPQLRWKRWIERGKLSSGKPVEQPTRLLDSESFPNNICSQGRGPLGNGGLSIRSRSWMIRAIETCPHIEYNTKETIPDIETSPCRVLDQVNEDFYFAVVLNGLGAPLPPALEASLFSVEMLWPHEVSSMYPDANDASSSNARRFRSGNNKNWVRTGGVKYDIPVGFHKPWWYISNDILLKLDEACPYLHFILKP